MGWSCTTEVSKTMERMSSICRKQTDSSNTFFGPCGKYFVEDDSTEYDDGHLSGVILRITNNDTNHCVVVGKYAISPNGEIVGPAWFCKVFSPEKKFLFYEE